MLNIKGSIENLETLFFALRGFHLFSTESAKKDENRLEMSPPPPLDEINLHLH